MGTGCAGAGALVEEGVFFEPLLMATAMAINRMRNTTTPTTIPITAFVDNPLDVDDEGLGVEDGDEGVGDGLGFGLGDEGDGEEGEGVGLGLGDGVPELLVV
jgi:hypothetical protein